jgi:hypothetical protein
MDGYLLAALHGTADTRNTRRALAWLGRYVKDSEAIAEVIDRAIERIAS